VTDVQRKTYSVKIKSLGGTQTEAAVIASNGTTIIRMDKPVPLGGTGTGPAAFDLLTAGLSN
jgi:hypothetical protein